MAVFEEPPLVSREPVFQEPVSQPQEELCAPEAPQAWSPREACAAPDALLEEESAGVQPVEAESGSAEAE